VINCPPPFTVYKNINKAYPVYTKDVQIALKNSLRTLQGLEDTMSLELKTKTTKLRADLDNVSSRIEMLVKSNLMSYFAGICDPKVREGFQVFQTRLGEIAIKLSQVQAQLEGSRGPQDDKVGEAQATTNSLLKDLERI
jgi:hypothetical protein